jgi:hypothetical protein
MNKVLYNVTVSVDEKVHLAWLEWMKREHIPEVMMTGYFLESRICRIHGFEEGGVTYAIQYLCNSQEDLAAYQEHHAPKLQAKHTEKYGPYCAAFRTVLEIIHEDKTPIGPWMPN